MIQATCDHQLVRFSGSEIAINGLKSAVRARVGSASVISAERGRFSCPVAVLGLIGDLLDGVSVDENTLRAVRSFRLHAAARQTALANSSQIDLGQHWGGVLDAHQVTAVMALCTEGLIGACLFDEQGSGKTVMAIATFERLSRCESVSRLIVLCPKSMISSWVADFERLLPNKFRVAGIGAGASASISDLMLSNDVVVTNYESIGRSVERVQRICAAKPTMLVVDESFLVKNENALRTQRVAKLRSACAYCCVLCGTPAPNSHHDVRAQFDIADRGFTFCSVGAGAPASVIAEAIDSRGMMIRRLKSEVLPDLGAKSISRVRVELSDRQRRLYDKVRSEMAVELQLLDRSTKLKQTGSYFAKRDGLLKICSCPQLFDPAYAGELSKLRALDQIVAEVVDLAKQKLVIWAYHRSSLALIAARYESRGVVSISGDTTDQERACAVESFQSSDSARIFVGSAAAAGAGITLTAASQAVYYSISSKAQDFLQSVDRIHRRGQNAASVCIRVLVSSDTIEERDFDVIQDKALSQQDLLRGDRSPPFTVQDALNELGFIDGC